MRKFKKFKKKFKKFLIHCRSCAGSDCVEDEFHRFAYWKIVAIGRAIDGCCQCQRFGQLVEHRSGRLVQFPTVGQTCASRSPHFRYFPIESDIDRRLTSIVFSNFQIVLNLLIFFQFFSNFSNFFNLKKKNF